MPVLNRLFIILTLLSWGNSPVLADHFEDRIAPLLLKHCVECHNPANPSGGLNLTTIDGLTKGGNSGDALQPGDSQSSYLLERIVDGEMPPKVKGVSQKLAQREAEWIRTWIDKGANWPQQRTLDLFERTNEVRAGRDWWSLQPVRRPPLPILHSRAQPANPIDAFILAKLEKQQMVPAPAANKRTLIIRLYNDLLGLPPTRRQVEDFVADRSPEAWENLIDSLLTKPQYGERWARYWLDLVRYAETSGYERDQEKRFAWKYRDWVVNAFNNDLPYHRFVLEQIAGDEVPDRNEQSVIATGVLRLGTWNDEPNEPGDYVYDRLEDLVHTTSSTFLGLTVKCARCHTHKFDPILQDDYYRMASVFWPGPIAPRDSKLLGGPTSAELGFANVLGWTDLTVSPPPIKALKNGERSDPLHEVLPGSLSFIPSLKRRFDPPGKNASTTGRRLQLARWITAAENPLTPRVLVNRLWQHHFGHGIVRTPNNFGFLSDSPTHPQLLDWLAAEFNQNGGSIKSIHRIILTSETWKQSSLHPHELHYRTVDSTNRFWWKSERRRLDAETLRDSMLAVSGELDLKVGGESFKATVSAEALEGLSRKSSVWQASPTNQQNRRSLYMYLKRGLLPPMMTTFDLCDATQSTGKREVTTVPTQALAMLNNHFVHHRSQNLARQIADKTTNLNEQVDLAWSKILLRGPTEQEKILAIQHLKNQKSLFQAKGVSTPSKPQVADNLWAQTQRSLALHLRADQAIVTPNTDRVQEVRDLSKGQHHATQPDAEARPVRVDDQWNRNPVLRFNGQGEFLRIKGQPLTGQEFTIICVVNDAGAPGHREIISNWSAGNNVGSSLFLGLTADKTVRFSDVFAAAGEITNRKKPFILSAVNHSSGAAVFQSGRPIAARAQPLALRKLGTEWIIGQQGNINGEFWQGGIAEIRLYNQALSPVHRQLVESRIAERYGLSVDHRTDHSLVDFPAPRTPEGMALSSLCHVLINSNEFIYVD